MLVVAAACAVVVGACGGGSDELTKAEFRREANRVCRASATRIRAVESPDPADAAAIARAGSRVVAIQRRALEELRDLEPPKDMEAQVTKWLALVDQTLDQARASVRAQREGDTAAAVTANGHGATLDARADEIASRYGLSACGAATPTTS
jgi:hypothetical protein